MTRAAPVLRPKSYDQESVFRAEALLREARRQKRLDAVAVPEVCVLDPDGDIFDALLHTGRGSPDPAWACYHTNLLRARHGGLSFGVVSRAVGAPFAVLVAEELFASGCELLVSLTSAGRVAPDVEPPFFVLIERAWRDEGTSLHYLPPSEWSELQPRLRERLRDGLAPVHERTFGGSSWTTDAPFRETPDAIAAARRAGVVAVEMEAAALYAFATARQRSVVCVAHVTNAMAVDGQDFEKGHDNGVAASLAIIEAVAARCAVPKRARTREDGHRPAPSAAVSAPGRTARDLLDERFARGEIDASEYVRRRDLLASG